MLKRRELVLTSEGLSSVTVASSDKSKSERAGLTGPGGTNSLAKKLETVRLYRCRGCGRTFTPGPRAIRNKTYPLNEILEAFTIYNRGNSPEDTSRRRFCQDC